MESTSPGQKNVLALVAVSAATYAIDKPYTYRVPDSLYETAVLGARVLVPFGRGNRKSEGIILSLEDSTTYPKIKNIEAVLDDAPLIGEDQIKLALWMSGQFFCTVFDALKAMLPAGIWLRDGKAAVKDKIAKYILPAVPFEEIEEYAERIKLRAPVQSALLTLILENGEAVSFDEAKYMTGATAATVRSLVNKGYVEIEKREVFRRPSMEINEPENHQLSVEQQQAYNLLKQELQRPESSAVLLHGVTGSGKTTIYIKLIEDVIRDDKTAIVLVPEISLTPQLMSIFASHFNDKVAVLHSALTLGERYDEWKRIKNGDVLVVIGTRSAIFAPLENIGLIVLDEEQEYTYKSESSPRYHACTVAKYRCAHSRAMLLLGSATPSVETMYRAKTGVYSLVTLESRYNERGLPHVLIADMKEELKAGNGGSIGRILENEIRENLHREEQCILFINRRGASSLVSCGECGYTFSCPHCDVSLTYHSVNGRLMCHYCGYSRPNQDDCEECGGRLKYVGTGTQKVGDELGQKLPEARILRMDADTISAANPHSKILSDFRSGKGDILLGTQMVAKGLDFPNVTLVGVIHADLSLYVNDYRASERTFSLITQVIGRAGRGSVGGRAVIQTMTPENQVIRQGARQDYNEFYEEEIERRRGAGQPPFRNIITITATGLVEEKVLQGCVKIRNSLKGYLEKESAVSVLGPAPVTVARINDRYRYRITLMCNNTKEIRDVVAHTVREFQKDSKNRGVTVYADIDPYN